jgi:hypothetical protein
VAFDPFYFAEMLPRLEDFWEAVQTQRLPRKFAPLEAKVPGVETILKTVDVTNESFANEWGAHAATYLETIDPAKKHEGAKKALKELVNDDVGTATGFGITITRDKRGALTVRELAKAKDAGGNRKGRVRG